ncbi:Peroxisomal hydratase-dehydrogenase-epimerase [Fusarium oligoseptatum]|uniref:Peroxisomal hydratase-dehydrogenase-epimerase n=1 Tax=Fusarium oligoseptatum TaxID=2604345 RepID=A0A428TXI5_9HYPO|nr:Peroxisomal hydratase-dehydrogenase-epimerase [Fusarium oligoseptatum]
MDLRFEGQVAVVTGAGSGLGKAYAKLLASRGASVVVNDLGASLRGDGSTSKTADTVVAELIAAGGNAVANYNSVEDGAQIIQTAIRAFGRIDILINNAGILRDVSFKNMTDQDWDLVNAVHVRGAYKTTHAAWPYFKKQQYGRVIMTSSAAGLYGNFGQCNYSAAKSAMIGFGETLAKEGAKYNILTNIIAPVTASRMTATVMPPDVLHYLSPEWVAPVIAVLVHSNTTENGSIFEVGAGYVAKLRWERAAGASLRCDESLTPGAVLAKWNNVQDFSNPAHPTTTADMVKNLRLSQGLPSNPPGEEVRFDGRVAVVTGGGAGLGRAYSILLAKLGASVVVNDLINPDTVVNEIRASGGVAVPSKASVEDGDAVIQAAIDVFGRVDILINNAGILRDRSFQNMTDKMWDDIMNVHLRGTYKCAKAAYPYMLKQKYGRIINTTSTSGIYGNYGQANYAAAKTAVIGFSRALAIEGRKNNIMVNVISPSAGTQLTQGVLPEEVVRSRKPEYIAPLVLLLCSDKIPSTATGQIFESGCGWQGRIRWQRTGGHDFPLDNSFTPEEVSQHWKSIVNFEDGRADHPESSADSREIIMANVERAVEARQAANQPSDFLSAIAKAKNLQSEGSKLSFTDRETILYNISLGATQDQLSLVFERHPDFQLLPTFGVIPGTTASRPFNWNELVPNFSSNMVLHGEHFLEIRKHPLPTAGHLVSYPRLIEVVDKGKASIAVVGTTTKDADTGEDVFYNEFSLFMRGSGGFGGPSTRPEAGAATTSHSPPSRKPDAVMEEATSPGQAMIYRLNGDRNPLHIDPSSSSAGGFKVPILHGLCSFGISGKHIVLKFGSIKSIKTRFVGTVTPGETLATEMWKEGSVVLFQTRVKETGKLCMASGGAQLMDDSKALL